MQKNAKRALWVTAGILVLAIAVLTLSGFVVRNLVSQSFRTAEHIRASKTLAFAAQKDQLDEETGLRGFAATRDTLFLDPYRAGRAHLGQTLAALRKDLESLDVPSGARFVDDAQRINAAWFASVAHPLLSSNTKNASAIERHGKALVDRYRFDFARIDAALDRLETDVNGDAQTAIDRISAFVGLTILVIVLFALTFFMQQARLGARLELARLRAEEQRRRTAELRASYEAEKRVADTLQGAFSQRPLPKLPLLRFSATYVPATEETKVGGDWYDALELPEGRVLFAIGDVAGHGIDAAVTMNRARQALISSALFDPEPASVLQRVNFEMLRENAPMVTAVAGFADARTYEFVYASAGHPPPVIIEPGRAPRMLEFGSLPLGISHTASYRSHRIQTVPGAMLVLYTDGALEHSRNVLEGEELLLEATAAAAANVEVDAATVIHNAIFHGRSVGDDVAILTIGFASDPASGLTISADYAQTAFNGRVSRQPAVTPKAVPSLAQRISYPFLEEMAS